LWDVAVVIMDVSEEHFISVFLRSVLRLLVTANFVPSSPILDTYMMEAILSSETSVITEAKRRKIPVNSILHVINSSETHIYRSY
jgi:hypothetical protein